MIIFAWGNEVLRGVRAKVENALKTVKTDLGLIWVFGVFLEFQVSQVSLGVLRVVGSDV